MRRFSNSRAFTRMRLVNGAVFVFFGVAIAVRTFLYSGAPSTPATPVAKTTAFVLAGAMVALGALRLRWYFQARAQR